MRSIAATGMRWPVGLFGHASHTSAGRSRAMAASMASSSSVKSARSGTAT